MKKLLLALLLASTLAACAWWQRNESKINCAVITSVENASQLRAIIVSCAAVNTNAANILPCIANAVGSQWASDVWNCFAGSIAGLTTCPAAAPAMTAAAPDGTKARLREALEARGTRFSNP